MIKNVAAMMFCPNPEKFFPYTQVEIVIFPEGVFENPRNFKEVPPIRGTVPQMIEETMRYLRTMVIQLHIIKQTSGPSKRIYNYPEKALEEAICNAFYHRDYRSRTPIVVEVQPYEITVTSATGPDRSIPMDAIQKGQRMVSRYYRNRRLGEFLKELSLTEGRNTGIPTIQRELARNGSPSATFETDEDRLSFLVRIPCHKGEEGVSPAFMSAEGNAKENKNHDKESHIAPVNDIINRVNDPINGVNDTINIINDTIKQKDDTINDTIKELPELHRKLVEAVRTKPEITRQEMIGLLNVSDRTISRALKQLQDQDIILREGAKKNGRWILLK